MMKKIVCFLLLAVFLAVPAFAAEFAVDAYATMDGMSRSWYQGYEPEISYNTMTLCLPLRAESYEGDITVSLALDDPNVFLLTSEPQTVTVSQRNGIYPVKLRLSLQRYYKDGDYPATITIMGVNADGKEIIETIPHIIRIRDGYSSFETLTPVIADVVGELQPGNDGNLTLSISNPTSTISLTDGILTVTDAAGEILMTGSSRFPIPEILPGKSETLTIPMTVKGNASIAMHNLAVKLSYKALGKDGTLEEQFTVPVTQAIRLEQGGVQLPPAIAGELANMTLPLMNMGKGELSNVLVKLEMDGVLDAQSVLVGTIAAGETKQAKLTFTPFLDSTGTHSGTVSVTCEDAYGNQDSQTLKVSLIVEKPIPVTTQETIQAKEKLSTGTIVLIVLCVVLASALITQSAVLNGKIHKLEEERL